MATNTDLNNTYQAQQRAQLQQLYNQAKAMAAQYPNLSFQQLFSWSEADVLGAIAGTNQKASYIVADLGEKLGVQQGTNERYVPAPATTNEATPQPVNAAIQTAVTPPPTNYAYTATPQTPIPATGAATSSTSYKNASGATVTVPTSTLSANQPATTASLTNVDPNAPVPAGYSLAWDSTNGWHYITSAQAASGTYAIGQGADTPEVLQGFGTDTTGGTGGYDLTDMGNPMLTSDGKSTGSYATRDDLPAWVKDTGNYGINTDGTFYIKPYADKDLGQVESGEKRLVTWNFITDPNTGIVIMRSLFSDGSQTVDAVDQSYLPQGGTTAKTGGTPSVETISGYDYQVMTYPDGTKEYNRIGATSDTGITPYEQSQIGIQQQQLGLQQQQLAEEMRQADQAYQYQQQQLTLQQQQFAASQQQAQQQYELQLQQLGLTQQQIQIASQQFQQQLQQEAAQFNQQMSFQQQQLQQDYNQYTQTLKYQYDSLAEQQRQAESTGAYRQQQLGQEKELTYAQMAQQKAIEDARIESQKQETLAQLKAQPGSWMEYSALANQTPAVQPWMLPLMPQQYSGLQAGQPIPGWEGESAQNMPNLLTPSTQYQARMAPASQQQYYGYEEARTGAPADTTQWRLWSQAPPAGGRQVTYAR